MYTRIYPHTQTLTLAHIYIHAYIQKCRSIETSIHFHTNMQSSRQADIVILTYIHAYIHPYIQDITSMHADYTYIYIHTYRHA